MNRKLKLEELNRVSVEEFKKINKIPVSIILDDIRSLHNVGSIFRTADAFKIKHIYLCGITAQPPHREITKTALGATESVDWSYHKSIIDLITKLKQKGEKIYSIEQTKDSTPLNEIIFKKNDAINIIVGNEVEGVSQEAISLSDTVIEIPQFGTKHSLNVANCTSILLWETLKTHLRCNF